jgi:hypothetical protein
MIQQHLRGLSSLAAILISCRSFAAAPETGAPGVPGVVVAHSPAASGRYIGSPSIAVLPGSGYVASHDFFGPNSNYRQRATTRVFSSDDRGRTWRHQGDIDGQLWSTLFVHRGDLYILGTLARYNDTVIRRSRDGGKTWTDPKDEQTGVLLRGPFHCAPVPVTVHNGRLWRAMEYVSGGEGWGTAYQAFMMSARLDDDLLQAEKWTCSDRLPCDKRWLAGKFGGWLEGNAVVLPDGRMADILRVEYPEGGGKAAIVTVSDDGRTLSFDPETGFVDLPGGCTKFTIRFDPVSRSYWALSNVLPARHLGSRPGSTRNTLALIRSADLREWEVRSVVAYHHDARKHGFQYPDWLFDGDDIVAVSRTAYDDGQGGAHSFHDANFLTFHRLTDFRRLSDLDLPPVPPPVKTKTECAGFVAEGTGFEPATLNAGVTAFSNRNYAWKAVPERFRGWRFTRTDGGLAPDIAVRAKRDTVVYFATLEKTGGLATNGWTRLQDVSFWYTSDNKTRMSVFSRPLVSNERIPIPQGNWSGGILLIPPE